MTASPTRQGILELAQMQTQTCVSLFVNSARFGPQARQGRLRFKNLVNQAEAELKARNLRQDEIEGLLKPAGKLLIDTPFWSRQMEGLAVYLSGGDSRVLQLPFSVSTSVVVSDRFYVKPLLRAATNESYFILNLNLSGARLLECGPQGVSEFSFEGVAGSLQEAMANTEAESHHQQHSAASSRGRGRSAVYHGQGGGEDARKVFLGEWLGALAGEVKRFLGDGRRPLLLAGVDYVVGDYRKHDRYPHTLSDALIGSPVRRSPEDLRRAGWDKVKGLFEERLRKELERFHSSARSGRTAIGLEACLKAASGGKVEVLAVADDAFGWGTFSTESREVSLSEQQRPESEELFERACLDTLRNGGDVLVVDPDQVPGGDKIATILRF